VSRHELSCRKSTSSLILDIFNSYGILPGSFSNAAYYIINVIIIIVIITLSAIIIYYADALLVLPVRLSVCLAALNLQDLKMTKHEETMTGN